MSRIIANVQIKEIGKADRSGNVFTKECVEQMMNDINKMDDRAYGVLGQSENLSSVDIAHISHRSSNARIVDDKLIVDIEILSTVEGQKLNELLKTSQPTFGVRGVGIVNGNKTVDQIHITSIDYLS